MAIYEFADNQIKKLARTTFSERGIRERHDLQRLLREQIEIIASDTMVLAEEFGDWDESRRRIDLLCLDKAANIVLIELKRTEDGGHMELQSLRYAAMVSNMTFEQAVHAHDEFLKDIGSDLSAEDNILEFLGWTEDGPDEDSFAQDVRIVLASASFSKELTGSVLWLNDKGIDIRCVKMEPFYDGQRTLLDIQQVIPLPEAQQFQVQVNQKKQKERQARANSRDFSKFKLITGDTEHAGLNKRNLMYEIVNTIISSGINPEVLSEAIDWKRNVFICFDGELDESQFSEELMKLDTGGKLPKTKRFFCSQDQLFVANNKTYALTNQWGNTTEAIAQTLSEAYPYLSISIEKEDS